MSSATDLESLFKRFNAEGEYLAGYTFGTGHIHDTYKIETGKGSDDYLLQKLNNSVFRDIAGLQDNISRVTDHIKQKLRQAGETDIDRKCLTLIKTRDGNTFHTDIKGNHWRMFLFIPDHHSFEVIQNIEQAYEGGKAIGQFQSLLSDLPGKRLRETIPAFHDVESRLKIFSEAIEKDTKSRAGKVSKEIRFILDRQEEMKTIPGLGKQGKIPLRITHNDTKFNNILFDCNSNRALCLIDLDTVMPGYVHYDFGDALRTAANTAAEDEEDLSKVGLNMKIYKSFTKGYLEETRRVLNENEIAHLSAGPALMAYIMGLRFLTDYIMGDVYYKIHKPSHNLIRARSQFRLIESFEEHRDKMKKVITDYLK